MARPVCFLLFLLFATAAGADDQQIRRAIEPKLNGAKIEAVQPSSIPGLMEVRFRTPQGIQILYTDPKGENIVQGEIYDTRTGRNLTFEQTLQQVEDLTLYVFMFPVIRPERIDDSKSIWCAPDRPKAWLDLALRKKVPAAATCDNPVESIVALGQSIGVRATPTLFFENGERQQGGMSASDLRMRMDLAAKESRPAKAR